jgi:peptidoglycan/xylan/chitin deacetylase (PgdA/CDA1 family)
LADLHVSGVEPQPKAFPSAPGPDWRTEVQPIPVLLYHSISEQPSEAIARFAVTPAVFSRHLDLIEAGHQTLTVSDLAARLLRGEPLPRAPIVITFDDGFSDNIEVAAPMLAARRLTATIYLTTSYLSNSREVSRSAVGNMLRWEQLRDLEAFGLELGAHSHTHRQLDVLPLHVAALEMSRSKELLENRLGHRISSFAYPHGYSSPVLRAEVAAAGFDSACGVRNALSHTRDDRWRIARLTVQADTPLERVAAWLRGQSAPLAGPGESLRTRVWRAVRRVRHAAMTPLAANP